MSRLTDSPHPNVFVRNQQVPFGQVIDFHDRLSQVTFTKGFRREPVVWIFDLAQFANASAGERAQGLPELQPGSPTGRLAFRIFVDLGS